MPRVHRDPGRALAAIQAAERVASVDEERFCLPARAVPAPRVVHLHGAVKAWNERREMRESPAQPRARSCVPTGLEEPGVTAEQQDFV